MKKIFLSTFLVGLGVVSILTQGSTQTLAASTDTTYMYSIYNTDIHDAIKTLLNAGAIYGDEAVNKAGYYKDRIFINNEDANLVRNEAKKWMQDTVYTNIKNGLNKLLTGGYITSVEYENLRNAYYSDIFDNKNNLVIIHNNFLNLEKQQLNINNRLSQNEMYGKIKSVLYKQKVSGNMSNDLFDSWLSIIYKDIFSDQKNLDAVYEHFLSEYGNIFGVLKIYRDGSQDVQSSIDKITKEMALKKCTGVSLIRCTWNGEEIYLSLFSVVSGSYSANNTNPYYAQMKSQLGNKLAQLSLERLESSLKKTKLTERRYKIGSKNRLRLQATVILLEEEIKLRMEDEINIDSLLN